MRTLVACVVVVGCGGNDHGPVELDNLGMELATASCAKQFDCCTDAEITEQFMGITFEGQPITTEDQCVRFTNALFTGFVVTQYQTSIEMGRIEYDAAAAGACVGAVESLSCSEYGTGTIGDSVLCDPFITPKVTDGGACAQDNECTSDNCEGATTQPAADGACTPMPAEGDPCVSNCADGLYCGSNQSGTDTCQATKADGAPCNLDGECASDYCDPTDTCAIEPRTCDGR